MHSFAKKLDSQRESPGERLNLTYSEDDANLLHLIKLKGNERIQGL